MAEVEELRARLDPHEQGYAAFGCGAQPSPEVAADADALIAWCDGWVEAKDIVERAARAAGPAPGGDR